MLMYCPQCKGSFEGVLQCPKCGVRLLFPTDKPKKEGDAGKGEKWHQSAVGRIAVGLVLGLGLSYGLLMLASVMLRNRGDLPASAGAAMFLGLQAVALLAGGMLAGAGQRSGLVFGACVGVVCGVVGFGGMITGQLAGLAEPFTKADLSKLPPLQTISPLVAMVYGLPLVDALFGALGGLVGVMIWKPLPKLSLPASIPVEQKPVLGTQINLPPIGDKKALIPWAGPIAWIRVLIGMVVAVGGAAIFTKRLLEFLMEFGGLDKAQIDRLQESVAHGELIALTVLLGGCIAGATTPNGVKQGVLVGIGAGIGLVGYFALSGEGAQMDKLLGPLLMAAFLGPLGGWFGSELMPPATRSARTSRKKRGWL